MRRLLFAAIPMAGLAVIGDSPVITGGAAARQWRQQHERAIVDEFVALLSIPNVARDRANIQRNADAIVADAAKRGIEARLVSVPGANPVVFGEIRTPGATRTIVFYAHYDGQPVDPKEWTTPPCTPTLRDRPLESGGQVIPLPPAGYADRSGVAALRARRPPTTRRRSSRSWPRSTRCAPPGIAPTANLKFVFEGEEEAGSPHLRADPGRQQGAASRPTSG